MRASSLRRRARRRPPRYAEPLQPERRCEGRVGEEARGEACGLDPVADLLRQPHGSARGRHDRRDVEPVPVEKLGQLLAGVAVPDLVLPAPLAAVEHRLPVALRDVNEEEPIRAQGRRERRDRGLVVLDLLEALDCEHDVVSRVGKRTREVEQLEANVSHPLSIGFGATLLEGIRAHVGRHDRPGRMPTRNRERQDAFARAGVKHPQRAVLPETFQRPEHELEAEPTRRGQIAGITLQPRSDRR